MKKVILIFSMIFLMISCIGEEAANCNGDLVLCFQFNETTEGFDQTIGNDVYLRIYHENLLYSTVIVPYSAIQGGREYRLRKDITGNIYVVAWAVPAGTADVAEIPEAVQDRTHVRASVAMQRSQHDMSTHQPIGEIYLGTSLTIETSLTGNTYVPVEMKSCIARVTTAIHDVPELYTPGQSEMVWALVQGIKSELNTDFTPLGEDAAVMAEFIEKENDITIKTERQGLLPSGQDQFLSVDFYKEDRYRGTFQTDIRVKAGDEIHLDIHRSTITVTVNDWRVVYESVEWI